MTYSEIFDFVPSISKQDATYQIVNDTLHLHNITRENLIEWFAISHSLCSDVSFVRFYRRSNFIELSKEEFMNMIPNDWV